MIYHDIEYVIQIVMLRLHRPPADAGQRQAIDTATGWTKSNGERSKSRLASNLCATVMIRLNLMEGCATSMSYPVFPLIVGDAVW